MTQMKKPPSAPATAQSRQHHSESGDTGAPTSPLPPNRLFLNNDEAAQFLNLSPRTLEKQRVIAGTSQRVHILVKPTRADLKTNLVINTNRRTYHLELTATADTWMASVSWQYPLDQLAVLRGANAHAEAVAPVTDGIALDRVNFRYEVTGANPSWRPLRAFDDGSKVYVQFPAGIGQGEMPPLFILGNGDKTELVNYRVRSPYYIVYRLFAVAELRLGGKDAPIVRITRTDLVSAVDSSNHR